MSVATLDFEATYQAIVKKNFTDRQKRLRQPQIRLFDGNWVLRGVASMTYTASFQEIDSETGMGTIEMPQDYYLSQWIIDHDSRPTKNVHVAVDKDGVRWTGRMDHYEIDKTDSWHVKLRVVFKHDFEELKHILVWANPFLPDAIQFPRLWILFGPAVWALKTTLFVNILRIESSLWSIPTDPLDLSSWFDLDQSTWSMVVKPGSLLSDSSLFSIISARFKDFATVAKSTLEDAQLTPTFRRWLTGDPPAWSGAVLRNGCLVIDIVDKSGWAVGGTSFGGDIFSGLLYSIAAFTSDGYDTSATPLPDPAWPAQYSTPGWKSVIPGYPSIIYRDASGHSGIQTSTFTGSPAKDVQHVTGGHSMTGVNELISAAIQMAGDLTAMIPGVPPIGGAVDAVLKPLYTDVFLAFMSYKDVGRANSLSTTGSYYKEKWAQGADKAYSIAALLSLRTSEWSTRETFTHKLTVADGCPWIVGQDGFGNYYLGDRIGSTVQGTPAGKIYVDRVSEITLVWDRKTSPTWNITIGQRTPQDPVIKAFERIQAIMAIAHDLQVFN